MSYFKQVILILAVFSTFYLSAQIDRPSLSPRVSIETHVGMAGVKLDYGQPNRQGRKIFGALIPFDRVWRTGANSNTKIEFSTDVSLAEKEIQAGAYGLYTIPGEDYWTVIINKNNQLWGDAGYDEKEDLVRIKVPVHHLTDTLETLEIRFENFHTNGGDLIIAWENMKVVVPLFVNSDEEIFTQIDEKILKAEGDISAQTYFDAAQFYYLKGKDLDLASEWFDKAIVLRPDAFWFVYYKAELSFTQGKLDVAKKHVLICQKAALSSTSSDFGYIAKCKLLLEKINQKS